MVDSFFFLIFLISRGFLNICLPMIFLFWSVKKLKHAWIQLSSAYIFTTKGVGIAVLSRVFSVSWFYKISFSLLQKKFVYCLKKLAFISLKKKILCNINVLKTKILEKVFLNGLGGNSWNFQAFHRISNSKCFIQQSVSLHFHTSKVLRCNISGVFDSFCLSRLKIYFLFHYNDTNFWEEIEKMLSAGLLKILKNVFENRDINKQNALVFFLFNFYLNNLDVFLSRISLCKIIFRKIGHAKFQERIKFIKKSCNLNINKKLLISFYPNLLGFYRFRGCFVLICFASIKKIFLIKQKIDFFIRTALCMRIYVFLAGWGKKKSVYFLGLKFFLAIVASQKTCLKYVNKHRNFFIFSRNKILVKFNKPDVFLANCASIALKIDLLQSIDFKKSIQNYLIFWKTTMSLLILRIIYCFKYCLNWEIFVFKLLNKNVISILKFYTRFFCPILKIVSSDMFFVKQLKFVRDRLILSFNKIIKNEPVWFYSISNVSPYYSYFFRLKIPVFDLFFSLNVKGYFYFKQATANISLIFLKDFSVIFCYTCVLAGFILFYKQHDQPFDMKLLLYRVRFGCFMTFRVKHKKSLAWCNKRFGVNIFVKISFKGNVFRLLKRIRSNGYSFSFKFVFVYVQNYMLVLFQNCFVLNCHVKKIKLFFKRKGSVLFLLLCEKHLNLKIEI